MADKHLTPSADERKRRKRLRPPVTAIALVISDQTAYDVIGLTSRQFRDLLAEHRDVPRVMRGHRLLVRADVLLALLDRLAVVDGSTSSMQDAQPTTADEVLAKLDRRRSA